MSPINLETAVIQMYENVSLTEELTDNPAVVLLKWGEKQLSTLAGKHSDEEAFESDYKALRRLMKSMSKFTSTRHTMSDEEQQDYITNRILSKAQEIGFACTAEDIPAYIEKQKALDEEQNVYALISFIEAAPESPTDSENVPSGSTTDSQDTPPERRIDNDSGMLDPSPD